MKVTRILATIPAKDLRRAQAFYEEKLGLRKREERPDGIEYGAGDGTTRRHPPSAERAIEYPCSSRSVLASCSW
jgi:catechol 2,3-dioxygenase-like lactoylglutathione lyase family enzyme